MMTTIARASNIRSVGRPRASARLPAGAASGGSSRRIAEGAAIAAPLASALVGAVLLGRSSRERRAGLVLVGASLGALLTRWQLARAFHPRPRFQNEPKLGRLQLRRYAPHLRATTWVEASTWSEALSDGFQRLAAYVFGDNDQGQRLPMTTPVMLSMPPSGRERRASHAESPTVASLARLTGPAARQMALMLPAGAALSELPRPNDLRVTLTTVPARRVAVLAFRGLHGSDLPAHKRNELLFLVKCAGLKPTSDVWFAAYDGPTTLPFLRHNEVLVEVED